MNESTALQPQSIDQATATALAAITSGNLADGKAALEELTRRNRALLDGGAPAIADALARQATLLEAVAIRLFTVAGKSHDKETTRLALNGAFAAQRTLLQALGALHQVQRGG